MDPLVLTELQRRDIKFITQLEDERALVPPPSPPSAIRHPPGVPRGAG